MEKRFQTANRSAVVLALCLCTSALGQVARDQYGGILTIEGTATGYFHTQKFGNRWLMVDPLGHAFFPVTIDNFRFSSFGNDRFGKGWSTYLGTKYANPGSQFPADGFTNCGPNSYSSTAAACRWSYFQRDLLRSWGFTGMGTFGYYPTVPVYLAHTINSITCASNTVTVNTGSTNAEVYVGQTVTISGVTPSGFNGTYTVATFDGGVNFTYGVSSCPAPSGSGGKESNAWRPPIANMGTSNELTYYLTKNFSGGAIRFGAVKNLYGSLWASFTSNPYFADAFDSAYPVYVLAQANDGTAWDSDVMIQAVFTDQEDQMRGVERTHPHLGFVCAAQSPYLGFDAHTYVAGPQQYPDATQYCKAGLQSFLQARYGTGAGGLNALNTAWGTTYTTWSYTTKAWSGLSIYSIASTPVPLVGNGSTLTFSGYIQPHLPVSGGAVVLHYTQGGIGKTANDSASGNGTLAANADLASGSVNLTTGLVSLTFNSGHAPDNGTALTLDFTGGSWDYPGSPTGTGFMDENSAKLGSDWNLGYSNPGKPNQLIRPAGASTAQTNCSPIANCQLNDLTDFASTLLRQWYSTIYNNFQTYRPNHYRMLASPGMSLPRDYVFAGAQSSDGTVKYLGIINANADDSLNQSWYQTLNIPFNSSVPLIPASQDSDMGITTTTGAPAAVDSFVLTDAASPNTLDISNISWSNGTVTIVTVQTPTAYPVGTTFKVIGTTAYNSNYGVVSVNTSTNTITATKGFSSQPAAETVGQIQQFAGVTVTCNACNFWWSGKYNVQAIVPTVQFSVLPETFGWTWGKGTTAPAIQYYNMLNFPTANQIAVNSFSFTNGTYTDLKNALLAACPAQTGCQGMTMRRVAYNLSPNSSGYTYFTQLARGQKYQSMANSRFNQQAPNGDYFVAATGYWCVPDNTWLYYTDTHNFGLVTTTDNPYDGVASDTGSYTNTQGFTVGREVRRYGDVLDAIVATNQGISGILAATYSNASLPANVNLANGAGALSSCDQDARTNPPANVTDGILTTHWKGCPNDSSWIYVDLFRPQTVSKVTIKWGPDCATNYQLQTSNDAQTWSTQKSVSGGTGGADTQTFTAVSARYVRMLGSASNNGRGYSINEFEVYSP